LAAELSKEPTPAFEEWVPLARQVVRTSLNLGWKDVFEIYTYVPTIPLAEALALEARRAGSDTHLTLMTDDLWFTSMHELSTRWLRQPSPAEYAINAAVTADAYLGGPADARRMRDIPPEKFEANAIGGARQDEPKRKRRVRHIDLPIGRITPERAEAYGLDYDRWSASYHAALRVDLKEIRRAGTRLARSLKGRKSVRLTSDAGTDLRFDTKPIPPAVDDGIISASDVRRGFVLDGFPRTVAQAQALDRMMDGADPLVVVDIVVPEDELVRRLLTRMVCESCGATAGGMDGGATPANCRKCGGRLIQRSDDNKRVVLERLRVYLRETKPLVEYYSARPTFRSIDGTQAPDCVASALVRAIQEVDGGPPGSEEGRR